MTDALRKALAEKLRETAAENEMIHCVPWPQLQRLMGQAANLLDSLPSEGWRLVPVEPTREMLEAMHRAWFAPKASGWRSTYDAMLSAAPPSLPEGEEE